MEDEVRLKAEAESIQCTLGFPVNTGFIAGDVRPKPRSELVVPDPRVWFDMLLKVRFLVYVVLGAPLTVNGGVRRTTDSRKPAHYFRRFSAW